MRQKIKSMQEQLARRLARLFENDSIPEKIGAQWGIITQWNFDRLLKMSPRKRRIALYHHIVALEKKYPNSVLKQTTELLKDDPITYSVLVYHLETLLQQSAERFTQAEKIETEDGPVILSNDRKNQKTLLMTHLAMIAALKLLRDENYPIKPVTHVTYPVFINADIARIHQRMEKRGGDLKANICSFLEIHKHSYLPLKKQTLEALIHHIQQGASSKDIIAFIDGYQQKHIYLNNIYTQDNYFCITQSPYYKTSLYLLCVKQQVMQHQQAWDMQLTDTPMKRERKPTTQQRQKVTKPTPIMTVNKSTQTTWSEAITQAPLKKKACSLSIRSF